MKFTAQQIADILGGTLEGDPNKEVNSVAKIEEGCAGNLCFLSNEKYKKHLHTSNASVIIINASLIITKECFFETRALLNFNPLRLHFSISHAAESFINSLCL